MSKHFKTFCHFWMPETVLTFQTNKVNWYLNWCVYLKNEPTSAIILLVSPRKSKLSASSSLLAWCRVRFFRWMLPSLSSISDTFLLKHRKQWILGMFRSPCCIAWSNFISLFHFAEKYAHGKKKWLDTAKFCFHTWVSILLCMDSCYTLIITK